MIWEKRMYRRGTKAASLVLAVLMMLPVFGCTKGDVTCGPDLDVLSSEIQEFIKEITDENLNMDSVAYGCGGTGQPDRRCSVNQAWDEEAWE